MKQLLLLLLCFIALNTNAQNKKLDSLLTVLRTTKQDTTKVNTLVALGRERIIFNSKDTILSLIYAREALALAEKIGYKMGIALACRIFGSTFYCFRGCGSNYSDLPPSTDSYYLNKALGWYQKAEKEFKESGDKNGYNELISIMAEVLFDLGLIQKKLHDYPKAIAFFQKAFDNCEAAGERDMAVGPLSEIGGVYYFCLSDNINGMKYYEKALKVAEESGDKGKIANSLNDCANVYSSLLDYPKSLDFYQKELKIDESISDTSGVALTKMNIGVLYWNISDNTNAMDYFQKALDLFEKINDKNRIALTLDNIALVYIDSSNFIKALGLLQKSLVLAEQADDKLVQTYDLRELGKTFLGLHDYNKALESYKKGLLVATDIKNKAMIAATLIGIGEVYQKKGNNKEAMGYEKKGLPLALEADDKPSIRTAYQILAALDSAMGNCTGALKNYKLYRIYDDSLNNKNKNNKVIRMTMQYDYEKEQDSIKAAQDKKYMIYSMEQHIQQQENEKQKLIYWGCMVILALVSAFIFYNFKNQQKSNKEIVAKNEAITKEKQKSDNLLLNILPAEVAQELKEKGESEAQHHEEVSVLFTDFVNFTGISETLLPKELVAELHECFTAFDGIIEKNGLEKIKTIGDAYMAVCGLPQADPLHAQKTVQAALDIRDYIANRKENGGLFNIKIGINSGPLVAGIVGVKKFAYDVWGDTVNTAARMEQNGEAGKVNISDTTYELIKNDFTCEHRGKVSAKNKGEVDMYFVN